MSCRLAGASCLKPTGVPFVHAAGRDPTVDVYDLSCLAE
jgi:hypothetical protein